MSKPPSALSKPGTPDPLPSASLPAAVPLQTIPERVEALRTWCAREKLDGFYVPHTDAWQNEFLPPSMERLAWLTGFGGSAGEAVVLMDQAALFVDGRYTIQARTQADSTLFKVYHQHRDPVTTWLESTLKVGARIGFDPWQITPPQRDRLKKACEARGGALIASAFNPVDVLWLDRPDMSRAPAEAHPPTYAGRSSGHKRADLTVRLKERDGDAVVLCTPDSIAWLLNIRGDDVPYTPVVLAYAILYENGVVDLFLGRAKRTPALLAHLGDGVRCRDPEEFGPVLDSLKGRRVSVDPARTSVWVVDRLEKAGAVILGEPDPCIWPKACKNPVEVEGARAAHLRDGIAVTRFLFWLSRALSLGEHLTERSVSDRLDCLRAEHPLFRDLSFPTISATGPNASQPHYHGTDETNRRLTPGDVYLVDSGGQYSDGTTDVTRTISVGEVSSMVRRCYTLVLKGHIAVSSAAFPRGTTGGQLDPLARQFLWSRGLDYDHGTGHGVGSFLSVHEGPIRIGKAGPPVAFHPGMILSVEPGYYREGEFGIRIENLVVVVPLEDENAEGDYLTFETLTLVPYDRGLIETSLLSLDERRWINAYHDRVRDALGPHMTPEERGWLEAACGAI